MLRLLVIASLVAGCRISLESEPAQRACMVNTTSPLCTEAVNHSDLAWIEASIFVPNCNLAGGGACHATASDAGKLELRPGTSHGHLVNMPSMIDKTRKLVVPGDVAASYLMLMVSAVPPEMASPPGAAPPRDIGFMPQSSGTLCCQKLDALERWIEDGAPNN